MDAPIEVVSSELTQMQTLVIRFKQAGAFGLGSFGLMLMDSDLDYSWKPQPVMVVGPDESGIYKSSISIANRPSSFWRVSN